MNPHDIIAEALADFVLEATPGMRAPEPRWWQLRARRKARRGPGRIPDEQFAAMATDRLVVKVLDNLLRNDWISMRLGPIDIERSAWPDPGLNTRPIPIDTTMFRIHAALSDGQYVHEHEVDYAITNEIMHRDPSAAGEILSRSVLAELGVAVLTDAMSTRVAIAIAEHEDRRRRGR